MFWDNFLQICSSKGLKPTPVIHSAGLASSSIARWKSGGSPNGDSIVALADCLHCSTDLLLRGREYEADPVSSEEIALVRMLREIPESTRDFVYDSVKAAYDKEIERKEASSKLSG